MSIRLALLLLILASFSSCAKVSKVNRKSVAGSYDWYYSFDGASESFSYVESTDQYGIFIKPNGIVILYKNGEEINNGKMESFGSSSNTSATFIVKWDKWHRSSFDLVDNEVIYDNWPFNKHSNYFIKQEN